jgi:MFS family permease
VVACAEYALGALVMALASDLPKLFAGSFASSLGLGMFSAIDQALLLDVLPERETSAGRFMGITGFATLVPQSTAPLVAPLLLAVGANASGEKNYTLLYFCAAVCTGLAGLVTLRIKSVR